MAQSATQTKFTLLAGKESQISASYSGQHLGAQRRVNTGLKSIRWSETSLKMNDNLSSGHHDTVCQCLAIKSQSIASDFNNISLKSEVVKGISALIYCKKVW